MENRNSTITLNNGFPKLVPGENNISFSGGITSVEVIPKWWTL
jgi:phage-related protein